MPDAAVQLIKAASVRVKTDFIAIGFPLRRLRPIKRPDCFNEFQFGLAIVNPTLTVKLVEVGRHDSFEIYGEGKAFIYRQSPDR